MKVLYMSSLCPVSEYEAMFKKYGTTSSHTAQKFNRLIIRGLIENDCDVTALTQRIIPKGVSDSFQAVQVEEDGCLYRIMPRKKNRKLNRLYTIFRTFSEVIKWHKKNPDGYIICDIILGELSLGLIAARFFKKLKTIAIVTDVPSVKWDDNRKGIASIPMKIKNAAIQAYDGYIFLTEPMDKLLNPNHKPYTVMEGIADENIVKSQNLPENKYPEKVCIMAGLLESEFGVDKLIEAFENVKCDEARLYFYGYGGMVESIKTVSERDPRIQYCGELVNAEMVETLKRATLLINPRESVGEWTKYCFPSKNIEYISSGTPLVACNMPCIPEEYTPYYYAINPSCIEEFTEELSNLLNKDRSELHEFGLCAQKWAMENKTPKVTLEKIVNMLSKI